MIRPDADPLADSLAELPRTFGRTNRFLPRWDDTAAILRDLDAERERERGLPIPVGSVVRLPVEGRYSFDEDPAPDPADEAWAKVDAELAAIEAALPPSYPLALPAHLRHPGPPPLITDSPRPDPSRVVAVRVVGSTVDSLPVHRLRPDGAGGFFATIDPPPTPGPGPIRIDLGPAPTWPFDPGPAPVARYRRLVVEGGELVDNGPAPTPDPTPGWVVALALALFAALSLAAALAAGFVADGFGGTR